MTELAVVGAGPAGLAAAIAAARAGVAVTLIDEYPSPGGQYLKGAAASPVAPAEQQGRALLLELAGLELDSRLETLVWGLSPGSGEPASWNLALYGPGGPELLAARAVIIAAGARELVLPFPGWTLPGVMTAGAAQILAKSYGVTPGRRVLLAGSGPLLLPVANELAGRGAQVVAVLEATRPGQWLGHAPVLWGNWDRLAEGWRYLRGLRQAGIPYRFGWTVKSAQGSAELEAVVLTRVDRQGYPVPGSEESLTVDALCVSFGFVPNVELTRLAGCVHRFEPGRGGWVPQTDERLETTVPNLFVAGETAGVGGAGLALVEGRVAGLAAAQRLGYLDEPRLEQELAALATIRRRRRRFGRMLNSLFAPRPGLDGLMQPDTCLCRCEEVTAGEVQAAVAGGAQTLDGLKIWTRVGQGLCQGRGCGPLLARLLARQSGCPEAAAGFFQVRPPLKPVPLGDLAAEVNG